MVPTFMALATRRDLSINYTTDLLNVEEAAGGVRYYFFSDDCIINYRYVAKVISKHATTNKFGGHSWYTSKPSELCVNCVIFLLFIVTLGTIRAGVFNS